MSRSRDVVILGAGHAGVQVAASLRQEGYPGRVVLVGDEDAEPYQRPPLSKSFLSSSGAQPMPLRGESFYAERDIELRTGVRATTLDRQARVVHTSAGEEISYDHLVLALGARPRRVDTPGVHYLRTLQDAQALRDGLVRARRIAVVGGGFLGLEVASVASASGHEVTVIEAAPRLMGRAVSSLVGDAFARLHAERGVEVLVGDGPARIEHDGDRVRGVRTSSGRHIPADLVLVSIGALPNQELAAASGLPVADGVLVDTRLRTVDPAVSAIGDCARWESGARSERLESVQNATDQARFVAARLLGSEAEYTAVPWFWSDQSAAKLQIAGVPSAGDRLVVRGDEGSSSFSVFHFDGLRLTCVESIGRAGDHLVARRLLGTGTAITEAEAADVALDLKSLARERCAVAAE